MNRRYIITVYKAKDGHRWRITAHNGKIVAESGEAYERPSGAKKSVKQLLTIVERGLYDIEGEQGEVK
jgi:uncharacterized protein YegP (UPF0339 family)